MVVAPCVHVSDMMQGGINILFADLVFVRPKI